MTFRACDKNPGLWLVLTKRQLTAWTGCCQLFRLKYRLGKSWELTHFTTRTPPNQMCTIFVTGEIRLADFFMMSTMCPNRQQQQHDDFKFHKKLNQPHGGTLHVYRSNLGGILMQSCHMVFVIMFVNKVSLSWLMSNSVKSDQAFCQRQETRKRF